MAFLSYLKIIKKHALTLLTSEREIEEEGQREKRGGKREKRRKRSNIVQIQREEEGQRERKTP
jgi:hypothetical protein